MTLEKRLSKIEDNIQDDLPYPLNYLKRKVSDLDFQFIKESGIRFRDAMFIDSVGEEVERYRNICIDAGLLPPLNFE